jgi:hypothetical protein
MDSSPTLQDFVLNLIYDSSARSAFELDPETTLQHAGLGDVTVADVQQAIPFVVDNAPVAGLTDVAGVDDLSTGVANLDVAGAIAQLQSITAYAAVSPAGTVGADVNLAGVHTVAVVGDDLLTGSVLSGGGLSVAGVTSVGGVVDLGVDNDPALDLDAGVAVQGTVDAVVPGAGHILPDTDLRPIETLDTVTNAPSSLDLSHVTGLDVAGVEGATSSVVSVVKPDLADDVVHGVHGTVAGTVSGTVDSVHGVTGGLLPNIGQPADSDADHGLLGGITDLHH